MSSSFKSSLVLAIALCASLALTQVHGQGVNSRAASPDQPRLNSDSGAPGGAARNVYAQRQLSPHRMMHFGKRPLQMVPPSIMALEPNQVARYLMASPMVNEAAQEVDLASKEQQRELESLSNFPYSLYFNLPRNQVLEPAFEDPRLPILMMLHEKQEERLQQQQQPQQQKQKRRMHGQSRMFVDDGGRGAQALDDQAVVQVAPPMTTTQYKQQQQQQRYAELNQLDDEQQATAKATATDKPSEGEQAPNLQESNGNANQAPINLVNRSPTVPFSDPSGAGQAGPDPYTKAQIINYLYGRQANAPLNGQAASYKRKAEPGRMTFMHFG